MKFLVMAGTEDGRQLAEELTKRGHDVLVSTLTAYGADLAAQQGLAARFGAMDEQTLSMLLRDGAFNALVDATHPYAVVVKEMTKKVCREMKLPYLRWERSATRGMRGRVVVRPSGTEPKLKAYLEVVDPSAGPADQTTAELTDLAAEVRSALGLR